MLLNGQILRRTTGLGESETIVGLQDFSQTWTLSVLNEPNLSKCALYRPSPLLLNSFQGVRDWFAGIQVSMQQFPTLIRAWTAGGLVAVLQPWVDASEGKRLCWKICMLNAAVWVAWKISRWQPFMAARFMHNPLSGLSYTLLTSMFRWVRVFYDVWRFD